MFSAKMATELEHSYGTFFFYIWLVQTLTSERTTNKTIKVEKQSNKFKYTQKHELPAPAHSEGLGRVRVVCRTGGRGLPGGGPGGGLAGGGPGGGRSPASAYNVIFS